MFTGLIEGLGEIKEVKRIGEGMILAVMPHFEASDIEIGESIAVNGVCLTVTGLKDNGFEADVSAETLACTTTGMLKQGDDVNLERALRVSDRLGGHFVSGHIDGLGRILKNEKVERSYRLRIGLEENLSRYTLEKGSIAIDGISLTINRCQNTYVEVNIIPQTSRETTILKKKVGDPVNVETDMIGKYVEKFFTQPEGSRTGSTSKIDEKMLTEYGFGD